MADNSVTHNEIFLRIGQLEGKTDQVLDTLKSLGGKVDGVAESLADSHNKLDERIGALERSKAWLLGAAAAIGAIFSLAVNYILNTNSGH